MSSLSRNQKNNRRLANRRKKRHHDRCDKFKDDKLYYEASVLLETMEGQVIKDIELIQPKSEQDTSPDSFLDYFFSFFQTKS